MNINVIIEEECVGTLVLSESGDLHLMWDKLGLLCSWILIWLNVLSLQIMLCGIIQTIVF